MIITEIRLTLPKIPEKRVLAYVAIVFDDCFVVNDCRLIQGNRSIYLSMPDKKQKIRCGECDSKIEYDSSYCNHCGNAIDNNQIGKFIPLANPITKEFRHYMEDIVTTRYRKLIKEIPCPSA